MRNIISLTIGFVLLISSQVGAQTTKVNPADIHQNGATSGQVLKWDGTKWAPAVDGGSAGSLPNREIGFGNGTAIVSDTTLKFNSTTDKLSVSSVSNKARTDISGKSIEMQPDTTITQQTFLKILAGKYSPYTYAPFGLSVERSTNPTYPYDNWVWTFGPNALANSGVAFDPTKPMSSWNVETSWIDGGQPVYEIHQHWKQPDSNVIRLESYTIRHKNAFSPGTQTSIDYYNTADTWSVKGATLFDGNPQYFYASRNRTNGAGSFGLKMNNTNNLSFSGTGATAYISVTGPGIQTVDFAQNDVINFGSLGSFTVATNVFAAANVNADVSYAVKFKTVSGLANGIHMDNIRFITSGPSQVDFFGGFAAGPSTPGTYSGSNNIGIGYATLNGLTTGSQNVALGTFAVRNMTTGSNGVAIGHNSGQIAVDNYPGMSGFVIIGSGAGNNINDYTNKLVIENGTSLTPLISGNFTSNKVGINILNSDPRYTLDIKSETGNTVAVQRLQTTTDSIKMFVVSATPESVIIGRPGDRAFGTNGYAYTKRTGTGNTGWVIDLSAGDVAPMMKEENFTATAAQTAFTITYSAPAVNGSNVPLRVYRNGVRLFWIAAAPTITQFTYTTTTVTTAANAVGDIITVEYLN